LNALYLCYHCEKFPSFRHTFLSLALSFMQLK
jgi:hypothetical protein